VYSVGNPGCQNGNAGSMSFRRDENMQGKSFVQRVLDQDRLIRPDGPPDRVQHQKQILGVFGTIRIEDDIPDDAKDSPFRPGTYVAAFRFSNGQPVTAPDQKADVRGIAVKYFVGGQEVDLLATNEGGRSHARNAAEFLDASDALAELTARHVITGLELATENLVRHPIDTARALGILTKEVALHHVDSLTRESYWGSVVELAGRPIEYSVHPHSPIAGDIKARGEDPNFLREDLLNRLSGGPIRFDLSIQFFRDEMSTPVNDASVKWNAPLVRIGWLEITAAPKPQDEASINKMAFNPGNGFVALGITKDRQAIYAAAAQHRGALSGEEVRKLFAGAAAASV